MVQKTAAMFNETDASMRRRYGSLVVDEWKSMDIAPFQLDSGKWESVFRSKNPGEIVLFREPTIILKHLIQAPSLASSLQALSNDRLKDGSLGHKGKLAMFISEGLRIQRLQCVLI